MLSIADYYTPEPTGGQAFGAYRTPERNHTGDDFSHSQAAGTVKVPAIEGGTVVAIQRDNPGLPNGYGNQVRIRSGNVEWTYSHLHTIAVAKGDTIAQGQGIGTEGNTGWTSGPCVHVELWVGASRIDPYPRIRTILAAPADGKDEPFNPATNRGDEMLVWLEGKTGVRRGGLYHLAGGKAKFLGHSKDGVPRNVPVLTDAGQISELAKLYTGDL